MFQLRHFLLPLATLSGVLSFSLGPCAVIPVVNREIAPDGFIRPSTLALGEFPGPIIRAQKGDHFQLRVIDLLTDNDLDLPTSIHWHGLHQKGTNYADGVSLSPSVLSYHRTNSCTTLGSRTKRGHSGTTDSNFMVSSISSIMLFTAGPSHS